MKDKPAYNFRTFIMFYNIFQIAINTWAVYSLVEAGWFRDHVFTCKPADYSVNPQNTKFSNITWYILCLKLIDYVETILFVFRKKQRQVTFLHLYHHISTAYFFWIFLKYYCSAIPIIVLGVNCAVHVIMYTYYLLASFQSTQRISNFIKPSITIIQMVQFWFLIIHLSMAYSPSCPGAEVMSTMAIVDLLINFILFWNFYKKNYPKKKKVN
ncbi:elongation of very long chain fatty acids protein 1-like isoform X2 [Ceratina calcarata]|nr:elongation of very long chain fatty acids protein 1-like isoform X2 [Ceratina calcarata]